MSATFRKPMPSSQRCQHLPATAGKSPPGLRLTTGGCQFLSRGEGATCRTGVTPGLMLDAWSRASKKICESRLVQLRHGRLCKLESSSFTNLRPLALSGFERSGSSRTWNTNRQRTHYPVFLEGNRSVCERGSANGNTLPRQAAF